MASLKIVLSPKTILSIGHDVAFLASRKTLFQQAGYRVISTARCSTAIGILRKRHIDVTVLCHTVTAQELDDILWTTKASVPGVPVILLEAGGGLAQSTKITSTDPKNLMGAIEAAILPAPLTATNGGREKLQRKNL